MENGGGVDYQRLDGVVEHAINFEAAVEQCPFLGRMAIEAPDDLQLMQELYAKTDERLNASEHSNDAIEPRVKKPEPVIPKAEALTVSNIFTVDVRTALESTDQIRIEPEIQTRINEEHERIALPVGEQTTKSVAAIDKIVARINTVISKESELTPTEMPAASKVVFKAPDLIKVSVDKEVYTLVDTASDVVPNEIEVSQPINIIDDQPKLLPAHEDVVLIQEYEMSDLPLPSVTIEDIICNDAERAEYAPIALPEIDYLAPLDGIVLPVPIVETDEIQATVYEEQSPVIESDMIQVNLAAVESAPTNDTYRAMPELRNEVISAISALPEAPKANAVVVFQEFLLLEELIIDKINLSEPLDAILEDLQTAAESLMYLLDDDTPSKPSQRAILSLLMPETIILLKGYGYNFFDSSMGEAKITNTFVLQAMDSDNVDHPKNWLAEIILTNLHLKKFVIA